MAGGVKQVDVDARNVRQVIDELDQLYPGMKDRLVEENKIRPNLAVAIDGEVARMGLLERVGGEQRGSLRPGHWRRRIAPVSR